MKNTKNKYSFLFPGQGSQHKGMGIENINKTKESFEFYALAKEVLGYNVLDILNDDKLNQTLYTQPAIFINSIIKDVILKKHNIYPNAVAGHSLGEFSALVSSEVLSFTNALEIIKIRANEMENAGKENQGKMLAIIGATSDEIDQICSVGNILVPANFNSKDQTILSGDIDSVNKALLFCKTHNIGRAIPLKTSGAFHSPLMKNARNSLSKVIKSIDFKNAKVPIYQNTNPKPEKNADKIKFNLLKQLESPVQWLDSILSMVKNDCSNFIEVGPGKVLANLNRRISNNIKTFEFDIETLKND
mgnify:CR=1 FL=1